MVSAINSSLSGLDFAAKKLEVSGDNIANTNTPNYKPLNAQSQTSNTGGVNTVVTPDAGTNDLAQNLVNTQIASYDFKANLKVIKASNDTLQSFLNIIS